MKRAKIVIGANYGDEGKGLMTDYFCREAVSRGDKCLSVCTNGGPQRGHTVVTPEGARHIFHHLGSGSFAGADTYVSDAFLINPMIFREEYERLREAGANVRVFVNPACRWTTPYDMILNQMAEEFRGKRRHGSCGFGIWETVLRYQNGTAARPFGECDEKAVREVLIFMRDEYVPARLREIGMPGIPEAWREILAGDAMIGHYIEDWRFFKDHTAEAEDDILDRYDTAVFENGQGLLLDMGRLEVLDHTTPSKTGLAEPARILKGREADTEACYVTRTYLTRHGAGPMEDECEKAAINADMIDRTNVPNPFQGTMRYGLLDADALLGRIREDFGGKLPGAALSLAVTHVNETGGCLAGSGEKREAVEALGRHFDRLYVSDGEERKSVRISRGI